MAAIPRAESRTYSCTERTDCLNRSKSRRTMLPTRASERDDCINEVRSALSCLLIIAARVVGNGSVRAVLAQGLPGLRREDRFRLVVRVRHDQAHVVRFRRSQGGPRRL